MKLKAVLGTFFFNITRNVLPSRASQNNDMENLDRITQKSFGSFFFNITQISLRSVRLFHQVAIETASRTERGGEIESVFSIIFGSRPNLPLNNFTPHLVRFHKLSTKQGEIDFKSG